MRNALQFLPEDQKGRDHLHDLGVDERQYETNLKGKGREGVVSIHHRVQWQGLMKKALWPFPIRIILELWILQTVGRTLGRMISAVVRSLPTQDNRNKELTRTDINASRGIRTLDPCI
jgi:hypothetical protein